MRSPILVAVTSTLLSGPVVAQERKDSGGERPPVVEWVYEAKYQKGNRKQFHRSGFVTQGNKVFMWDQEIGTVATQGDKMTLVIKRDKFLKGRIVLKRDGNAWYGEMVDAKDKKWSIFVTEKEEKSEEKKPEKKAEEKPDKKPK